MAMKVARMVFVSALVGAAMAGTPCDDCAELCSTKVNYGGAGDKYSSRTMRLCDHDQAMQEWDLHVHNSRIVWQPDADAPGCPICGADVVETVDPMEDCKRRTGLAHGADCVTSCQQILDCHWTCIESSDCENLGEENIEKVCSWHPII